MAQAAEDEMDEELRLAIVLSLQGGDEAAPESEPEPEPEPERMRRESQRVPARGRRRVARPPRRRSISATFPRK